MRDTSEVKDEHLTAQADLLAEAELPLFASRPRWQAARTVLDLGCGNGAYTARLADTFPAMRFLGLDINAEAIARARAAHARDNVTYVLSRISSISVDVDVLLSRFCLMYVDDMAPIAAWAAAHVRTGVLQIDNHDDLLSVPAALEPVVDATHIGLIRRAPPRTPATTTAPAWVGAGFRPAWEESTVVGDDPGDRDRLAHFLLLGVELRRGAVPPELAQAVAAWRAARGGGDDAMRIGVRATWFDREGAGPGEAEDDVEDEVWPGPVVDDPAAAVDHW